jgi:hypothetical protein
MTRYFIISISFLALCFLIPETAKTAGHNGLAATENVHGVSEENKTSADTDSEKNIPLFPASKGELPHGAKATAPHMEELPHIHRFHKERVKKIKQHHTRFWMLSKALVILCHISILVIGYLHAIH